MVSHINAVPYLALAMEQCWLSNSSQVTSHASVQDKLVINAGCPTDPSVNMHWDKGSSNSAFSFMVSGDNSDQLRARLIEKVLDQRGGG